MTRVRGVPCRAGVCLQDVSADLRVANPTVRSPHRREVVLPDGVHNLRGYVKPPSSDLVAAFKERGKFSHLKSGRCASAQRCLKRTQCLRRLHDWHSRDKRFVNGSLHASGTASPPAGLPSLHTCHRSDTASLHCLVFTNSWRAGPWPVKPQHLQELAAKEQDGPDKASAADAEAQKQRQKQQASGRQSAGGGPAVVEQVLQLNNELFMTPEALFR